MGIGLKVWRFGDFFGRLGAGWAFWCGGDMGAHIRVWECSILIFWGVCYIYLGN